MILLFIVDPPFVTVNQSLHYVQTGNMVTLVCNVSSSRLKFTLFIYGLKLKLYLYFSKSIHIVEKKTRNHNIRNTRLPLCNEDNTVDINSLDLPQRSITDLEK
jgi:hypothetical protein